MSMGYEVSIEPIMYTGHNQARVTNAVDNAEPLTGVWKLGSAHPSNAACSGHHHCRVVRREATWIELRVHKEVEGQMRKILVDS